MVLITQGHDYIYEVQSIIGIFLPGVKISLKEFIEDDYKGDYTVTKFVKSSNDVYSASISIRFNGVIYSDTREVLSSEKESIEYAFAVMIYDVMHSTTGIKPKWGILTGIRPVKLAQKKLSIGWKDKEITDYFTNDMLVLPDRAKLMLDTAKQSRKAFDFLTDNSFSLYVGIPFCPSRCSYCSFVSHSIERTARLIPDYVEKLCMEVEYTASKTKEAGMVLKTVYVGGGTPTSISAEQLECILKCIGDNFDMSSVLEYTVEAGRADTITMDKLRVIKNSGVTRISINPQTFNDDVLRVIGRNHTANQVFDSFNMARDVGFNDINMDLIAGLNSETLESFMNSIDKAVGLSPENITVHTLAVKRSSDNATTGDAIYEADGGLASKMMDYAYDKLGDAGYVPYYLYRQRNMRDNLENVGFGKDGKMGLYNIYTMEEVQSIVACGAGAVSKLYNKQTGKIIRIFNYKFPYEYLNDFHIILQRKDAITSEF